MPESTLSVADLLEIQKSGAKIQIERTGPELHELKGLSELVQRLERLIEVNERRAQAADHRAEAAAQEAQVMREVIQTLQALARKPAPKVVVDLSPLKEAIAAIPRPAAVVPTKPTGWNFEVKRSRQGFLESIRAMPTSA